MRSLHGASVRTPFLAALALFSLLYAMGNYTPVFPFLWEHLPIVQRFRTPSKSLMCFVLALSCLSGVGFDYLRRSRRLLGGAGARSPRLLQFVAWAIAALLCLTAVACLIGKGALGEAILRRYFNLGSVEDPFKILIPWNVLARDACKLAVVAVLSALLLHLYFGSVGRRARLAWIMILVAFCDLLITSSSLPFSELLAGKELPPFSNVVFADSSLLVDGRAEVVEAPSKYLRTLKPSGGLVRFAATAGGHDLYGQSDERMFRVERDVLRGRWALVDRAFRLQSEAAFGAKNVGQVLGLLRHPDVPDENRRHLYALLNCDRVVLPYKIKHLLSQDFDSVDIRPLGRPLPRAFVAGGVRVLADRKQVLRRMAFGGFDPAAEALAAPQEELDQRVAGLQPQRVQQELKKLEYGINRLSIEIWSAKEGVLVVSDTYYPGWVAQVNGRDSPIFEVNGAFRGLHVPSGTTRIEMTYRPNSLRIGVLVSLFTLAGICLAALAAGRSQQRRMETLANQHASRKRVARRRRRVK
jgi:hypothetical protein